MPIIIKNVSKTYGHGKQKYNVYINEKLICEFIHDYKDGLAECLHKASKAVELQKMVEIAERFGVI